MDRENERDHGEDHKKSAEPRLMMREWLRKLCEPLTVVTLLLFGATVALYCATRDLVHDAEIASERQLRAYLGLMRKDIVVKIVCPDCNAPASATVPIGTVRNSFQFFIKNFGLTPAYRNYVCAGFAETRFGEDLMTGTTDKTFNACDANTNKIAIMPTISPGEDRPYTLTVDPEGVEIIRNARLGKSHGFLFGRFEYFDIFEKLRHSYFCYRYYFDAGQEGVIGCGNFFTKDT